MGWAPPAARPGLGAPGKTRGFCRLRLAAYAGSSSVMLCQGDLEPIKR
jgi:hypothetical protein